MKKKLKLTNNMDYYKERLDLYAMDTIDVPSFFWFSKYKANKNGHPVVIEKEGDIYKLYRQSQLVNVFERSKGDFYGQHIAIIEIVENVLLVDVRLKKEVKIGYCIFMMFVLFMAVWEFARNDFGGIFPLFMIPVFFIMNAINRYYFRKSVLAFMEVL